MRPVGSVLCPIIVGRDDLLDLAERRMTEASGGRGQFLLLAGEAGIGKSRLLDAIRRKARAAGFVAANGSLAPQDRDVPAALIGDLARGIRRMPELGTLGEDLVGMRAEREADALGSRRLYVLDVVDRIAAGIDRRVLLDFEDLQWADEISLEIVGELARRARELQLLVVATYRAEDLQPGSFFREWRARLIGQRLAEEIRLAPLTRDQTALMTTLILDTGLPAPREVVDAVYERTDGIPLHVEELLGAIGDEARSDGRAIRDAKVPDTIEDAVLARIAQLSPDAREVARAGAVIGRCFVPEVLAGIMDRPVSDLDAPLEELIGRSYLQGAGPGMLDFRHQLLRDVLYRSVPAPELRRLHARAAEFGAALDGQSEIHASAHFERAGLRAQAFRAALAGARSAGRMSGRREAFELYRRAIDNMPDDLPAGEQAELYDAYGQ
ncbi:MAG TPA: BREX system ATP-binding domain-containing protein, partial [Candidatus Sulfomarinibacteraceae bacterium]|nr:BREX system ATP-binding domain-containing protein [Candidatus Sulfomarinibacteraceae bacterium]